MGLSPTTGLPAGEMADLTAWVVRGGSEGESVASNLSMNRVALGWGNWLRDGDDIESADEDALDRLFDERFRDEFPSTRRRARQEIMRFLHRVDVGDLVVLPLKGHDPAVEWIAIGRIAGRALIDTGQPDDSKMWREVAWLTKSVPDTAALPDLQSSIKQPQLTVFQPRPAGAARRLLHIAAHREDPG